MEIPITKIVVLMKHSLKKAINKLGKKQRPNLTIFFISKEPRLPKTLSIKSKIAKELNINLQVCKIAETRSFESLMHKIKEKSNDPTTHGVVIHRPLPAQLSTESIYDFIALKKEIEGHRRKTSYLPPIGNALLTVLKYIFTQKLSSVNPFFDPQKDSVTIKKIFKNKKVVYINKGNTDNASIGKSLTDSKINYISITPLTPEPESYYKEADVLITTVDGFVKCEILKKGVVFLNINGVNSDKKIKKIASYYSSPKNPIELVESYCLFRNLIDAVKLH